MEHERFDPELDDLLNDIHRLINEETKPQEADAEADALGLVGLFDEVMADLPDLTDVPELEDMPDLTDIPELEDLPDLTDIPELEDMPDLTDIPELEDLPDLTDIPELEDMPDLTDIPELEDMSDLTDIPEPEELPEPAESPEQQTMPEAEPAPEQAPEEKSRWTDKQKMPKHVAKLQKNQDQAYADWLYAQENAEPAPQQQPQAPVPDVSDGIRELGPTRWTDRQKVPRHVAKLQQNQKQAYEDWLYEQDQQADRPAPVFPEVEEEAPVKKKRKKKQEPVVEADLPEQPKKKKKHGFRNFLIFLVVLTLAAAAVTVFVLPKQPAARIAGHRDDVSTILLIGTDAGGVRTDTLMLASVNRSAGSISLVSIPRDTLVNGEYTVPKINSVYAANNGGAEGIEMLMTRVEQCVGFRPDGYVLLQLDSFVDFVDILGGVEFDVPVDMFYNDPSQDLYIALQAGYQTLNGEEALGLVRFRSGYADADLGRVQVQRDFLSSLIRQTVSPEGIVKAPLLLQVLQKSTETDLTAGNFLWLAQSILFADRQHIDTVTLPGSARNWESGSYYVLDPASVAQTVNTYCNPCLEDVTVEDLQIRTN